MPHHLPEPIRSPRGGTITASTLILAAVSAALVVVMSWCNAASARGHGVNFTSAELDAPVLQLFDDDAGSES